MTHTHTAKTERGCEVVFCSACGAYGSRKAVLLKGKCQPASRGKRQAQWVAINERHVHPVSKETLRDFKKCVKWRAFVLGRPPQDLCPGGGEASGLATQKMGGGSGQGVQGGGDPVATGGTRLECPGEESSEPGAGSEHGWDLEQEWLHPFAEPPDEFGPWTGFEGW